MVNTEDLMPLTISEILGTVSHSQVDIKITLKNTTSICKFCGGESMVILKNLCNTKLSKERGWVTSMES